jgi:hypothetical protein
MIDFVGNMNFTDQPNLFWGEQIDKLYCLRNGKIRLLFDVKHLIEKFNLRHFHYENYKKEMYYPSLSKENFEFYGMIQIRVEVETQITFHIVGRHFSSRRLSTGDREHWSCCCEPRLEKYDRFAPNINWNYEDNKDLSVTRPCVYLNKREQDELGIYPARACKNWNAYVLECEYEKKHPLIIGKIQSVLNFVIE